ncbi:MAG: AAA family ATPase, partial [Acidimicrobiia bacterium]|nr:AAA family ATPase [Acidimicrobiia bacterium]
MTFGSHQGRLVLVVDPDLGFADALTVLLAGDRIIAARTMAEAAAIAEGGRIDLALIGPSFGTEDGVASASVLRDADRSLLAVLVADVPANKVLRAALRAGVTDVVDAPVTARKMAELLGRTDALDAARSVPVVFERQGGPVGHAHVAIDPPAEQEIAVPELVEAPPQLPVEPPVPNESYTHASAAGRGIPDPFDVSFSTQLGGAALLEPAGPFAAAPETMHLDAGQTLNRLAGNQVAAPATPVESDRSAHPGPGFPTPPPMEPSVEEAPPIEMAFAEPIADAPAPYEAPPFQATGVEATVPAPAMPVDAAPLPAAVPDEDAPFAPPVLLRPAAEAAPMAPSPPPFDPAVPPMPLAPPPVAESLAPAAPPENSSPPPARPIEPAADPSSDVPMPRHRPGSGRVITVMAGKGGSGKTITATNLAASLTEKVGEDKVVIVDADLQFGDVALMLQVDPIRTNIDVAAVIDDLTENSLDGLLLRHESGLRVLAAPLVPAGADKVGPKDVVRVAEMLRGMYSYIIIDTAPIFDDGLITILEHSDDVLVVVDMDLPSVKNAKIAIDTLRAIGFDMGKVSIIVNRANSKARLDINELERALGERIAASIPSDRLIPQSVNEGVPAVAFSPRSRVAKAF